MCFTIAIGLWILVMIAVVMTGIRDRDAKVAREFTGVVTDRRHEHTLTTGMRHDYILTIRADDGEVFKFSVNSSVFGSLAVGDRIVKCAGARWPEKA